MKIKTNSLLKDDDSSQKLSSEERGENDAPQKEETVQELGLEEPKDKVRNVSPQHFASPRGPLVPFCMVNVMEWLASCKPSILRQKRVGRSSVLQNTSPLLVFNSFGDLKEVLEKWLSGECEFDDDCLMIMNRESISSEKSSRKKSDPWSKIKFVPREFKVIIEESTTFRLFEQKKKCAITGSKHGNEFVRENLIYSYNIKRCKKLNNEMSQTRVAIEESKLTAMDKPLMVSKGNFMCLSDYYDSRILYKSILEKDHGDSSDSFLDTSSIDERATTHTEWKSVSLEACKTAGIGLEEAEDKEFLEAMKMVKIIESDEFFKVSLIVGRILERTSFELNQKKIKKGNIADPTEINISLDYSLIYLRRVNYIKVWGLPVTSISVNPVNKNVFAVGHGQYFTDQPEHLGRVNLWNSKNLCYPEKSVDFEWGVTAVAFSAQFPYALLVSLVKGYVLLLDVAKKSPTVIAKTPSESLNDCIWQVYWFKSDWGRDIAVSCCSGGVVNWYHWSNFERHPMLVVDSKEGEVRGIEVPRDGGPNNSMDDKSALSFLSLPPNIFCLAPHPTNPLLYLAGSEDGCVHKCSTDCWNKQLESIQAHHGPVYHIKYHPDTPMVYLTVGIDYCVRIWAPNIYQPLITITFLENFVEAAEWSPSHPTILATISGNVLSLWDIRRIVLEPCSSVKLPSESRFSELKFLNGNTIICGDVMGDVHIFNIKSLPFVPVCKPVALATSIKRVLSGNDHMLDQLRKLGYPFDLDGDNDFM